MGHEGPRVERFAGCYLVTSCGGALEATGQVWGSFGLSPQGVCFISYRLYPLRVSPPLIYRLRLPLARATTKSNGASVEVSASERLELLEVLTRLEAMDANDTRTVTSWKKVRDTVPKVWKREKPVRDALIGEAVKKALDALGNALS